MKAKGTEMDRRNFLTISLGAVLLPSALVPAIPAQATKSAVAGADLTHKVVILFHDGMTDKTEDFFMTEAQMFGHEAVAPITLTAERPCTVTGLRAEFLIDGHTKSTNLLKAYAGKTWKLKVGETLTVEFPQTPLVEQT